MFWMVAFSLLFLNVIVLNILSVHYVCFFCFFLNALNICSVPDGCIFSVICSVLLHWHLRFSVVGLQLLVFYRAQSCGRKNPDAYHILATCRWCQMCDWPQLVIVWRLEYFISYTLTWNATECREHLRGGGKNVYIHLCNLILASVNS